MVVTSLGDVLLVISPAEDVGAGGEARTELELRTSEDGSKEDEARKLLAGVEVVAKDMAGVVDVAMLLARVKLCCDDDGIAELDKAEGMLDSITAVDDTPEREDRPVLEGELLGDGEKLAGGEDEIMLLLVVEIVEEPVEEKRPLLVVEQRLQLKDDTLVEKVRVALLLLAAETLLDSCDDVSPAKELTMVLDVEEKKTRLLLIAEGPDTLSSVVLAAEDTVLEAPKVLLAVGENEIAMLPLEVDGAAELVGVPLLVLVVDDANALEEVTKVLLRVGGTTETPVEMPVVVEAAKLEEVPMLLLVVEEITPLVEAAIVLLEVDCATGMVEVPTPLEMLVVVAARLEAVIVLLESDNAIETVEVSKPVETEERGVAVLAVVEAARLEEVPTLLLDVEEVTSRVEVTMTLLEVDDATETVGVPKPVETEEIVVAVLTVVKAAKLEEVPMLLLDVEEITPRDEATTALLEVDSAIETVEVLDVLVVIKAAKLEEVLTMLLDVEEITPLTVATIALLKVVEDTVEEPTPLETTPLLEVPMLLLELEEINVLEERAVLTIEDVVRTLPVAVESNAVVLPELVVGAGLVVEPMLLVVGGTTLDTVEEPPVLVTEDVLDEMLELTAATARCELVWS